MKIMCTGCKKEVEARLTNGKEMYPYRDDLAPLHFWVCDACGAFVGTHMKNKKEPLKPLGFLTSPDVKAWRMQIHRALDPLWKADLIKRGQAYAYISNRIGRTYHTGEIYDVEDGKKIYAIVLELKDRIAPGPWNK